METVSATDADEIGQITVDINPKFDRETDPVYDLTVLAVDRGTPPLNGTTMVYVNIKDVNDENPKFSQSTYLASIIESASVETSVIQCPATDEDLDSNLTYSISNVKATYNLKAVDRKSVEVIFCNDSSFVECSLQFQFECYNRKLGRKNNGETQPD